MRKVLKNVSFVILLLKSYILLGQDLDTKKIIVIEPGHGRNDSGAIRVNNLKEKSITLEIARLISELIRSQNYHWNLLNRIWWYADFFVT